MTRRGSINHMWGRLHERTTRRHLRHRRFGNLQSIKLTCNFRTNPLGERWKNANPWAFDSPNSNWRNLSNSVLWRRWGANHLCRRRHERTVRRQQRQYVRLRWLPRDSGSESRVIERGSFVSYREDSRAISSTELNVERWKNANPWAFDSPNSNRRNLSNYVLWRRRGENHLCRRRHERTVRRQQRQYVRLRWLPRDPGSESRVVERGSFISYHEDSRAISSAEVNGECWKNANPWAFDSPNSNRRNLSN
jgi:hypothetical protein